MTFENYDLPEHDYQLAVETVYKINSGSVSALQRNLGWGCVRAAAAVERMEAERVISPMSRSGRREVYPEEMHQLWLENKALRESQKIVVELEKGHFVEHDPKELFFRVLRASKVLKTKQNWVHVMEIVGCGWTVAYRLCTLFNVDPEGMVFEKKDAKEDIQMLDTADFLKEIAIEHTINR